VNAYRTVIVLLVTLALAAVAGQPALASGPTVQPEAFGPLVGIDTRPAAQLQPAVDWGCPTIGGRFLTVYENQSGGAAGYDIAGRLTDDQGFVADPAGPFAVVVGAADQRRPAVAQNRAAGAPGDSFMVAWMSNAGGNWDIYVQVWGCNKAPLSPPQIVSRVGDAPSAVNDDMYPDVICGTLSCWVVWDSNRTGNWDIFAQVVNGAGVPVGANVPVTADPKNQRWPAIQYNGLTGCAPDSFLVVWQDSRNSAAGNGWDIYGRQLHSIGPCSAEMATYSGLGNQQDPDLAFGRVAGQYQVVWQDDRNGTWDIYGEIANPDGTPAGLAPAIATGVGNQLRPAVAYDAALDRFLTVWQDNAAGNFDLAGQLTNGAGAAVGGNFPVPVSAQAEQNPAVAWSRISGHFYINGDWQSRNIFGIAYW